ncbi:MAG: hypothetical protein HZC55_24180 [Verrucomicrobia bacterium]|nr:hypothetical protein [Verrucomicrobiota bacterium]
MTLTVCAGPFPAGNTRVSPYLRLLPALCFASGLGAQTLPPNAADQAWSQVTSKEKAANDARVRSPQGIVATSRTDASRYKAEVEARAQKYRAMAQAARDFHSQHTTHPKAAEARKLEALAGVQGITPTDKTYERSALAVARAFRTTPTHPIEDRIQVAHSMEAFFIGRKTLTRHWYDNPFLAETMLDRLRGEFGEQPEIWGLFLSLAQNTYCDAGKEAAMRIVQSAYAPRPTKELARRVLERYSLVRQPLDFPLTLAQGRATTLGELAGKTTIVCLWDGPRHPEGPPGLHDFKAKPLPNTKWVFISVGVPGDLPKGAKSTPVPSGSTCVESLGRASPIVARLKVDRLPYVFVLDEQRRLSGYGRVDEIPALIAGIGRPVLP